MNVKKVNIILKIFIICFFTLFLISTVYASDELSLTNNETHYYITSDLSNDNIQNILDSSNDGDTFEFTSYEYNNISLVIDKPLNMISNGSTINTANLIVNKSSQLGISETFGFYFTKNSAGSIMSGFNMVSSSDYAIIVNSSDNILISANNISGATNNVLVRNSDNVSIIDNYISKAKKNGIQLQNVNNLLLLNNTILNNGRSGVETSNMFYSNFTENHIGYNGFNGISMYNGSSYNVISHNFGYENTNGIYICCQSSHDQIVANSFYNNRKDPNCELGGFETGNGVLFGPDYLTVSNSPINIEYNYLAHNENYQAKNNPDLGTTFKLGANYYDSADDTSTYICPMLLSKIFMRLDVISVSNGFGLQVFEGNQAVNDFGTFDVQVNVDGNQYTATVKNGRAVFDVDPNTDHVIEYQVGDQTIRKEVKAQGTQNNNHDSNNQAGSNEGSSDSISDSESNGGNSQDGTSTNEGSGNGQGSSTDSSIANSTNVNGNSHNSITNNAVESGNYGSNSSDVYIQSESDNGENQLSNGDENVRDSSDSESSQGDEASEGKAYEISPISQISKSITNNSAIVVIAIIALVVIFMYGYRRKNEFD